jgi:subtilisin-like proprotein convertase family protein
MLSGALTAAMGSAGLAQTAAERPVVTLYSAEGLAIPESGPTTPYPGLRGSNFTDLPYTEVEKVTVTLHGFAHSYPDDVWLLLTHDGFTETQKILLMGGCGGQTDALGLTITFDPDAAAIMPDNTPLNSGAVRPAWYGTPPTFPAPAPAPPYATTLDDLRGGYPGIGWRLWVYDASGGDAGFIESWSMTFHCRTKQVGAWDPTPVPIPDAAKASKYPSSISVFGAPGPIESVWVRLGLSHPYPADLDLLLTAPDGTSCVLMSDCGGSIPANLIQFNIADSFSSPIPTPLTDPGGYRPTDLDLGLPDFWPAPAPLPPYATSLSAFNAGTPNGTWRLWAVDDTALDTGTLSYWLIFVNGRVFCSADFNSSGAVSVQDIFDFLAAYFAGCP